MVAPRDCRFTRIALGGKPRRATLTCPTMLAYEFCCAAQKPLKTNAKLAAAKSFRRLVRIPPPPGAATFCRIKTTRPARLQKQAPVPVGFSLEAQVQAKLNVAGVQSACGLAEGRIGDLVVRPTPRGRQQEVGAVEDIERLRFKLQVDPLGQLEVLAQSHVRIPLPRTNKRIPAQVADATQTRSEEGVAHKIGPQAIGPLVVIFTAEGLNH